MFLKKKKKLDKNDKQAGKNTLKWKFWAVSVKIAILV